MVSARLLSDFTIRIIDRAARDFVVRILKFDSNLHNAPAAAKTQIWLVKFKFSFYK